MSPSPGEVWLADLGMAAKTRPVFVVSRFDVDAPRALAIYVPLTNQNRGSRYEVQLPRLSFLRKRQSPTFKELARGASEKGACFWRRGERKLLQENLGGHELESLLRQGAKQAARDSKG